MIGEPIRPRILGMRVIPNVDPQLAEKLHLGPRHRAAGLLTCTIDDCLYAALDAATKFADVDVVLAKSFYAGSSHASGPLSGEIIGVLAGCDEEDVTSGLRYALEYLETKAFFVSANEAGTHAFFPHVIASTGRYLSAQAGVEPGSPMAYLIAPPLEAAVGLDAALKAANVTLKVFIEPPSETNFSGGLLVGDIPAVEAAARAFAETIIDLAANPQVLTPKPDLEILSRRFARPVTGAAQTAQPYRILDSGLELDEKPKGFTHLFNNRSLVPKTHPAIAFRGKLDLLQAYVLDSAVAARAEGFDQVAEDLDDVLGYLRRLLAAEVAGTPMPELTVGGLNGDELQKISHNTLKMLGVGWVLPESTMGATVVKLNLLRAASRDIELAAIQTHGQDTHLTTANYDRMIHGLNRLSSAIYVLVCKTLAQQQART